MVARHPAGSRHPALVHGEPGADALPRPLRPVAVDLHRPAGRPGRSRPRGADGRSLPPLGRRPRQPSLARVRATFAHRPVAARQLNDDLRAIAELFAFVAANPAEARQILGAHPWSWATDAHAAGWFRQVSRIPRQRDLNDEHYVDDHALAQIPAALPPLGLSRDEQMLITRGDRQQVTVRGFDDPQAMRMNLLQILTGRRASEIRTCLFDYLSPVPAETVDTVEGSEIARFHYAQSKIDKPSRPSSARQVSPMPSSTTTPTCVDASNACEPRPARSSHRPPPPVRKAPSSSH